jgi:phage terminase small subunit
MPKGDVGKLHGRSPIKKKDRDRGRKKGLETRRRRLTIKQRRFVKEYVKDGNATQSALAAYDVKKRNAATLGQSVLRVPKVRAAIEKALKKAGLDEEYVTGALKEIIESGKENREDATPADALRGIDTYLKLKGYIGGNSSNSVKISFRQKAERMDVKELKKSLEELDKRQELILGFISGDIEEGEEVKDD